MFKTVLAAAAVAGFVSAAPQAVTSAIAPKETTPAGCSENYDGEFLIQVVNVTSPKVKRDDVPLVSTLKNGVLTDAKNRIGYIASNNQFQYDGPPQAGAIYTAGFSVCQNGSLALGNSAIFYQCLSGTFYNLYDENDAGQCSPVYIQVIANGATSTADAQQLADGQVTASPVADVACQIGDGQLQRNTCTGAVVTQIGDGQIQAATSVPVVSQIADGQIQAPTAKAAVVSQISDGQIQAPTATAAAPVVSQIADGQIQVPGNATAAPTVVPYTGAASATSMSIFGLVAGLVAVLAL